MGRKKRQADHVADKRGGGFIGLPKCVKNSLSYRTLSYPARSVLIEIIDGFKGYNNGSIALSQAALMEALGTSSPKTVVDAVAELLEHGLIDIPFEGEWKPRLARTFRLTFVSTTRGAVHVNATNDYLRYTGGRRRNKPRT